MRHKHRRWLFIWTITHSLICCLNTNAETIFNTNKNENTTNVKEFRNVLSPRMDYEHWTPLGRSDPLKNDPTYDYAPPVLERVHYWMDPAERKPDPPLPDDKKTEILLLGVTAKKSAGSNQGQQHQIQQQAADSRRDYDPFLKFVDGPKFNTYQRLTRPMYQLPYSYYPSPFYKNKRERIPYTMLMPPPIKNKYPSSTTQVPIAEESNINEIKNEASSLVTWRTPLTYPVRNKSRIENVRPDSFEMTLNSDDVQISGPDVMYKGQVSDADLDIDSTYVNIGKAEAQVQSISAGVPQLIDTPVLIHNSPLTLQSIQTMQTMLPPPIPTKSTIMPHDITPQIIMSSMLANIPRATTTPYTTTTTTTSAPTTTTAPAHTTDPLFKHYKQPLEPLRGPMYLIIQGHSKVKTYRPIKHFHEIKLQDTNEIPTSYFKEDYQVQHLHTYKKKPDERVRLGKSRNFENLAQVVQTGLGAIDNIERRSGDNKETEVEVVFDVADDGEYVTEAYRKGYVEEDVLARNLKEA